VEIVNSPKERARVIRQIWLLRAFIVLLVLCLVDGWLHVHNAPLAVALIGTVINLVWVYGTATRIKRLQNCLGSDLPGSAVSEPVNRVP
jgi:hypothetical protein